MVSIHQKIKYLKGSTGTLRRSIGFQVENKHRQAQECLLDQLTALHSFYRNLSRLGSGLQSLMPQAEAGRNQTYMPSEEPAPELEDLKGYFQGLQTALQNDTNPFRQSEARTIEAILEDLERITGNGFGSALRFLRFARIGLQNEKRILFN